MHRLLRVTVALATLVGLASAQTGSATVTSAQGNGDSATVTVYRSMGTDTEVEIVELEFDTGQKETINETYTSDG